MWKMPIIFKQSWNVVVVAKSTNGSWTEKPSKKNKGPINVSQDLRPTYFVKVPTENDDQRFVSPVPVFAYGPVHDGRRCDLYHDTCRGLSWRPAVLKASPETNGTSKHWRWKQKCCRSWTDDSVVVSILATRNICYPVSMLLHNLKKLSLIRVNSNKEEIWF